MASLPREVHEVLEQEYVSMYGPLAKVKVSYDAAQVIDARWGRDILRQCGVAAEANVADVVAALNRMIDELPAATIAQSPALTAAGHLMLAEYEDHARNCAGGEALRELNRRILDDAFTGAVKPLRDRRLDNVYDSLHARANADPANARTALCISGGGIRSATFALGVIQGLAGAKILDKFDYLSTVSGGGYIGGWLSSWARRHPRGMTGVQDDLVTGDTATKLEDKRPPEEKIEPEPKPLRHLREYSNYLSPRLGLLSGDTWTMVALYVRNLLLNLMVIVPILAFVLAIPRLYALLTQATFRLDRDAFAFVTAGCLALAFGYIGFQRPVDHQQKQSKNTDGRFFLFCVTPLIAAAIAMSLFWADAADEPRRALMDGWVKSAVVLSIAAMTVLPFSIYIVRYKKALTRARMLAEVDEPALRQHLVEKFAIEGLGTALGLGTAALLLGIFATKVFDNPLMPIGPLIENALKAPALRTGISTTPWSSMYLCLAVPAVLFAFFMQASIFVGISSHRNEDGDREWWGRAGAWLLISAFAWAVFSGIAVFGPIALYHAPVILASVGGIAGIAAGVLGFSAKTPANKKEKEDAGATATAGNAALGLAVPLFVVLFLALISLGTTWIVQQLIDAPSRGRHAADAQFQSKLTRENPVPGGVLKAETAPAQAISIEYLRSLDHLNVVQHTRWWEILLLGAVALTAWLLSKCIGVNKFSMHALYRNRLIRAYLGASRYTRRADPFTGFDENDNLPMWQLRPELLWASSIRDAADFIEHLKTTKDAGVSKQVWDALHDNTKALLEKSPASAIDALVQNLNSIILSDVDLTPPAAWTKVDEQKQTPYPRAIRNRSALDTAYANFLTPMPRPGAQGSDPNMVGGDKTPRRGPMHIVNMALNLVSGQKLAWQQRKAESFTSSPYTSGSLFLGYRDSKEYGGPGGISLGTAVTISGAAASPNMGYHSSPAMAFLLTLFNVRLGWWLGNPGPVGDKVYTEAHPATNLAPVLAEATGRTSDTYPWIYLSDGGHFENLALYEMVLRRCHYIVLSDAGCDPKYAFEDLGNAIRKIRTDLGVPIDIEEMYMVPRSNEGGLNEGRYVATATIRYSAIDKNAREGVLIYIKPGVYKDDYFPRDVYNYAKESSDFPHESTADQFFSESQFESYRALGRHAINEICSWYPDRNTPRPRLPITRPFTSIAEFADFVEEKAKAVPQVSPVALAASQVVMAIKEMKGE